MPKGRFGLVSLLAASCSAGQTAPHTPAPGASASTPAGIVAGGAPTPSISTERGQPGSAASLRIEVGSGGELRAGGASLQTHDDLLAQLRYAREHGMLVQVEVDQRAPEKVTHELLNELRRVGINGASFRFVTERQPPPPTATPAPAGTAGQTPPGTGSLPELTVRTVGLHVGGGPNDDATRVAFKKPIEDRFDEFRRCYPLADEPGKPATFGLDLAIGKDGGRPEPRQARTVTASVGFKECMMAVFSSVEFPKPPRGPTVISYSLRFSLGGPK